MLKRVGKAVASITATTVAVIVILTVVAIVGQRQPSQLSDIGAYVISGYSGSPITCHRDNSGFTVSTDENGEILWTQPVSSEAELKSCIEAFKSGILPFDPRNYIGKYEAGFISWEGFDHEDIYHWGVPDECAPHYQFEQKSHPWLIDALGLVDTIEVTFAWTGTDTEWNTCFAARLKQIAEIDLSQFEIQKHENSHQSSASDDSNEHLMTIAEPVQELDGATVILNPSTTNSVPSHLPWYYADIIRNGVLIREDFARPGDVIPVGPIDATTSRDLPTDSDECVTILQLYADAIDEFTEQHPGWHFAYMMIADEDTATLRRCSIPEIDSAE